MVVILPTPNEVVGIERRLAELARLEYWDFNVLAVDSDTSRRADASVPHPTEGEPAR